MFRSGKVVPEDENDIIHVAWMPNGEELTSDRLTPEFVHQS